MHIDATGCVVQPVKFIDERIYLYTLAAHNPDEHIVFPLAHAVLSNHTAYEIGNFLCQLNRSCKSIKIKLPIIIITDVSFAIIQAVLKEFNNTDIIDYNRICYSFLYGESDFFPPVVIQFCTSHFAKECALILTKRLGY